MDAIHPDFPVGPVPDRLTIWPVEDGRYGLDAVYTGQTGYTAASAHEGILKESGIQFKFVQNLDGSWALRFGPLTAHDAGHAIAAFVR